jgi:hypothetical protein
VGRRSKREGGKKITHTHTHTPSILESLFLSLLHAASPAEDLHQSNKPKNHCCNYCQSLLAFFFQQQLEGGRQGGEGSSSSFLPRWFHLSFSALVVETCFLLLLLCKQEEEKEEEDKRLTVS